MEQMKVTPNRGTDAAAALASKRAKSEGTGSDFMNLLGSVVSGRTAEPAKAADKTPSASKTDRKDPVKKDDTKTADRADTEKAQKTDDTKETGKAAGEKSETKAASKDEKKTDARDAIRGQSENEMTLIASMVNPAAVTEDGTAVELVNAAAGEGDLVEAAVSITEAAGTAEAAADAAMTMEAAADDVSTAQAVPEERNAAAETALDAMTESAAAGNTETIAAAQTSETRTGSDDAEADADADAKADASQNAAVTAAAGQTSTQTADKAQSVQETVAAQAPQTAAAHTLQTTDETVAEDTAKLLAKNFPRDNGSLEIQLEPRTLGRITIQVTYTSGRASVAIAASNPSTVDLLSRSADAMAQILRQNTGEDTTVIVPQAQQASSEQNQQPDANAQSANKQDMNEEERSRHEQARQNEKQDQSESFLMKMKLGLV